MAVVSTTITTTTTTPFSFIHNPVLTDSVTHEIITIYDLNVCVCRPP